MLLGSDSMRPTSFGSRWAGGSPGRSEGLWRLLFVLAHQLSQMEKKPPVTLALVAANILCFIRPRGFEVIPTVPHACLQPARIYQAWEWRRLIWPAFLHADEMHLLVNMSSLLWKGSQLEPRMGSRSFALLVGELLLLSHGLMVLLARAAASLLPSLAGAYHADCSIGFSAVLFALKVVLNWDSPAWSSIGGVAVPAKYAAWAELILIQLLTPNASFLGHLSGICAGLLHVWLVRRLPRDWLRSPGGSPRPFTGTPYFARASSVPVPGYATRPEYAERVIYRAGQRAERAAAPRSRWSPAAWAAALSWQHAAVAAVAVACAVATNPNDDHFVAFVWEYMHHGLGPLPAYAASSLAWLQAKTGLGFRLWSYGLFSLARYQGLWFLGLFNTWLPLPVASTAAALEVASQRTRAFFQDPWSAHAADPLQVITALQVLIFMAWLLLPPRVMTAHFELSDESAWRRPWTLLLANFSHDSLFDLVVNLQILLMVGPRLLERLGRPDFLLLYLAGGSLAMAATWASNRMSGTRLWATKGADSVLYALLACHVVVDPYRKFVWLFDLELNSLGLLAAKLAYEYIARKASGQRRVWQWWSHVWGAAVGFAFAALYLEGGNLSRLPKSVVPPISLR